MRFFDYHAKKCISSCLSVNHCGAHVVHPGYSNTGCVPYFLIHYVISGCGMYDNGSQVFYLKSGDVFLIKPGEHFYYRSDMDDPWTYYFVGFYGTEAEALLINTGLFSNYVINYRNNELLKKYMFCMCFETEKNSSRDCAILGYLYLIFSCLTDYNKLDINERNQKLVNQAIGYINKHFSEDIKIDDLAQNMWITRSYLYRLFMKYLNMSPKDYLIEVRLSNASSQLRETKLTIADISNAVGFKNVEHFSRLFKKKFGKSPNLMRKYLQHIMKTNFINPEI